MNINITSKESEVPNVIKISYVGNDNTIFTTEHTHPGLVRLTF